MGRLWGIAGKRGESPDGLCFKESPEGLSFRSDRFSQKRLREWTRQSKANACTLCTHDTSHRVCLLGEGTSFAWEIAGKAWEIAGTPEGQVLRGKSRKTCVFHTVGMSTQKNGVVFKRDAWHDTAVCSFSHTCTAGET